MVTYSDGIRDVNLADLLAFHQRTRAGHHHQRAVDIPIWTIEAGWPDVFWRSGSSRRYATIDQRWLTRRPGCFNSARREFRVRFPALQQKEYFILPAQRLFKSMDTHKDQQELEQIFEQGKIRWP
jgi:hypothetical protein